jgi:hypothetical protein
MTRNKALAIIFVVSLFIIAIPVYAAAPFQIDIDGVFTDWDPRVDPGFFIDTYADATPARTDITAYGTAVDDNGTSFQSLAFVMVTDSYQGNGPLTGDSHQMVFYVDTGITTYQIVVQINNYCTIVNWVEINGTRITENIDYNAWAIEIPGSYGEPPGSNSTPDCAMEIELDYSIINSALMDLDSDNDGDILLTFTKVG